MADHDDTRTSSACDSCPAHCCSQKFGYQSVSLTYEEKENPLFKPHLTASGQLKLEGRHCRFLDASSYRCTIYDQRPHACRGFVCHDMENQGDNTLAMVYRNRALKAHLEAHGVLPPLKEDLFWSENERRVPTAVRPYSDMERFNHFDPGTRRFFKLCAETGEIVLEGRRRSTYRPWSFGKYRSTDGPIAAIPEDGVFSDDVKAIQEAAVELAETYAEIEREQCTPTTNDDQIAPETCASCAQ